jgi:hypothetical protein
MAAANADFHHLPKPAAVQPLKSAEPSILVISQTVSRNEQLRFGGLF